MKLKLLYEAGHWSIPGGIPYDITKTKKTSGDMSHLKYPKDRKRAVKNSKGDGPVLDYGYSEKLEKRRTDDR